MLAILVSFSFALNVKGDPSPSNLTIIDSIQPNTPAIATTSEDFHLRWVVQIATFKEGASLWIESDSLLGPDGVAAKLNINALGQNGNPIKVTPSATDYGAVDIDLSAKLARIGEYTGHVKIRYGEEMPIVKPIHASRTMVELPVEALGVERVLNQGCWYFWNCWRKATVWLNLQAPPDRGLTVTPTLTEFALNRIGKEKVQASIGSQSIRDGDVDVAKGIALNSGEIKRLSVNLSGLGETGEYTGKVRFASTGFKPKEQAFTVLVRDGWWVAVIPIILGALTSMWLRRYGTDQRPRLVARQRIATLGEQVDALRSAVGMLDETENRVLDALNQQLITRYAEATSSEPLAEDWIANTQSAMQRIAAKLPGFTLWANARRSLAALDPAVDAVAIQTKIRNIQTALETDADLTAEQKNDLLQLSGEVTNLRRDYVLAEAKDLQSEFDELRKIAGPEHLLEPDWDDANTKLAQVGNHSRAGEFDAARSSYEDARKIFANLLLEDFAARVATGTPVGLKAEQWAELKPQIAPLLEQARAATDAKSALAGYAQAYRLYLNAQITALLPRLLDEESLEAKAQKLSSEQQQGFRDLAADTAAKLRDAAAALTSGDLRQAYGKHIEALSDWKKLADVLSKVGEKMGGVGGGTPGTADVAPAAGLPPDASHAATLLPTVFGHMSENSVELLERTKTMDLVVDVLAIAFSALLGVQYIWGPNPTWGGLSDWIAALLWGLGLHQVSGFTFDGVLGLREKLLKK